MSSLLHKFRHLSKFFVVLERKSGYYVVARSEKLPKSWRSVGCGGANVEGAAVPVRLYGKSSGRRSKKPNIVIDENELGEVFEVDKLYQQYRKPVDNMKKMYVEKLSVRTNMGSIEDLKVKYNGSTFPLQDLAEVIRKSTKEVILEMGAFPDAIPNVMIALRKSGMGLNPSQDGNSVIIPVPKITKEHREALARGAKTLFLKCKDNIREVQNKNIKLLEDVESLSAEDNWRLKAQLTALGEQHVAEAEEMFRAKQKELLNDFS